MHWPLPRMMCPCWPCLELMILLLEGVWGAFHTLQHVLKEKETNWSLNLKMGCHLQDLMQFWLCVALLSPTFMKKPILLSVISPKKTSERDNTAPWSIFGELMEVNCSGVKEVRTFFVNLDEAVAWDYMTL